MNARIVGLLLLSVIPMLGGLMRLIGLSTGLITLEGHERFAADPIPAVLHIIGATSFAMFGALQFVPALRKYRWHRLMDRALAVLGVLAAFSGIWMVWRWPGKEFDGPLLNTVRVSVALASVLFVVLSAATARARDFVAHERWSIRAYALFAGAGTQVFTLLPFTLPALESMRSPTLYALLSAAGWGLNALLAEVFLRPAARPLQVLS